jgi:hypothetical protein
MMIETGTYDAEITREEFNGNCTRRIQSLYLDIEIAGDNENYETGTTVEIDRGLRQAKKKIKYFRKNQNILCMTVFPTKQQLIKRNLTFSVYYMYTIYNL